MSGPDLSALGVPVEADEPVFAEPWQAQAFALTVQLHAQGAFTWSEWAAALGEAIRATPDAPYYESWVRALERVSERHGLAKGSELSARKAAWAEAFRVTPHGRPVELSHSGSSPSGGSPPEGREGGSQGA